MVSTRYKLISGKKYLYAEHSFRMPSGKIKKLSKKISVVSERYSVPTKSYFLNKEAEAFEAWARERYGSDHVLTVEHLARLERMRVEFKAIRARLSAAQLQDLLDRFTVNFTYESNAIEGNSLTLKDVVLILNEQQAPPGHSLKEVYETKNTRMANQLLFEGRIKLTVSSLLYLHKIIVRETGIPPGFKKIPNFLMMRNVATTPPERVEEEMKTLLDEYLKKWGDTHPLYLAADLHGKFEKIHPFEDGNGRVGRVLINAILLEHGYPPLIIRKTVRVAYFHALAAYDQGHKELLRSFLLEKMENTFEQFFRVYTKYI